ncbi:MAG: hypothetical protein R2867_08575 [Caldilineaceae bacterium]
MIYGLVEVSGTTATLIPEFYINQSSNVGLAQAWEITGQYEMGSALPVPDVNNRRERAKVAETLQARFRALTHIIEGLAAYVGGDYADAEVEFSRYA